MNTQECSMSLVRLLLGADLIVTSSSHPDPITLLPSVARCAIISSCVVSFVFLWLWKARVIPQWVIV